MTGDTGTMIERMARAMWGWEMQTQMFRIFDDESDDTKRMFRSRARAALTALLEPTKAMVMAVGGPVVNLERADDPSFLPEAVFVDMIQAALDEKEGV